MNRIISVLIIVSFSSFSFQNITAQFDKETLAKASELLAKKKELSNLAKQIYSGKEEISPEEFLQHTAEFRLREYEEFRAVNKKITIGATALTVLGVVITYLSRDKYPAIGDFSICFTGATSVFMSISATFLTMRPECKTEEDKAVILKRGMSCEINRTKKYIDYCKEVIARKN